MALKFMYITNDPQVALIAEEAGVDRIFADMEYIGKSDRQGGMNTVQSRHTLQDVANLSRHLTRAELLVRVNPIHEKTDKYSSSREEIDGAIENGADILMLPYFKTIREVRDFVSFVDGRAKTMLLVETPEAVEIIDEILETEGIDEIFIGLNDLSLGYGMKFMFQLLADGTVEKLTKKCKQKGIPFGFGGLAALEGGLLPGKMVLKEHYRLGSSCVILSRSFCNTQIHTDPKEIKEIFFAGVPAIRAFEQSITAECDFEENRCGVVDVVKKIIEG